MRSHPEQTTSPPLMSRASLAPPGQRRGRRARSRLSRRLPPAVQRWGSRSPATHPSPTGWAGRAGRAARPASAAEPVSCRSTDVNRSELLLGAPRHLRAGASFRCARLVARRLVPPAPSGVQAPRDSAPAPSRGLCPLRSAPYGQDLPRAFSETDARLCAHTLTHSHTQYPARRPLWLSRSQFRCAQSDPIPPPPRGRVGHFSASPGSCEERGSREGPVGRGRRARPGLAAKRGASLGGGRQQGSRSRRRVGAHSWPRKRAGSGGGTAAGLRGRIPLSRALASLWGCLPHPGLAAGTEPPRARPRSFPLLASRLPLPPFPPPLPTFGQAPISA